MANPHNPLLANFASQPALVAPEMAETFESCLMSGLTAQQQFEARSASGPQLDMVDDFWFADGDWRAAYRPYVVVDGILQIPVKGVLLHDFNYTFGWVTGYNYIWRAFQRGMDDGNVKGIALVCDSPGGHVAGNFDLVDKMFALRGKKPVRGFAAEHAYSAAYSIISVSDTVNVARTGGVGSIGVVTGHLDVSQAMEKAGYKFTFIAVSDGKTDGNPYQPLPQAVYDRIKARIAGLYSVFVATVARNRGMDEQAVRDLHSYTFTASEALSNGLADSIGAFDDALAEFAADVSSEGNDEMTTTTETSAATQAAISAARAEGVTEGTAAGHATGLAEGAVAEKARITAILGCDNAKTRPAAALAAAMDTDMTADQASAFLGKLAEEKPAAKQPTAEEAAAAAKRTPAEQALFEAAMAKDNPELGSPGAEETGADTPVAVADRILTNAGYGKQAASA